jgi:excisionase family DNA binding protein
MLVGMRGLTNDPELRPREDDLLTTGEAAKVLNCTRQHVVDLCARGDLPYTTVGTHRRISRENVEAVKTRTDRLSRDERRSLWLAYVVAGRIATAPERTIGDALGHLDRMRPNARGQAAKRLDEWERLLNGPVDRLLAALTDRSLRGRELRQNSPFAGALTEQERQMALDEWRAHDVGNPRGRR